MAHRIGRRIDNQDVTGSPGGRNYQVVFWTAEHSAGFCAVFDCCEMRQRLSVDNLNGSARHVGHKHVATWRVNVPMVETACVPVRWDRNLAP